MSAEIIDLPVVTSLDLPPERVLNKAIAANLAHVIVVGAKEDGDFYFASNKSDGPECLWLLEVAKRKLLAIGHPEDD